MNQDSPVAEVTSYMLDTKFRTPEGPDICRRFASKYRQVLGATILFFTDVSAEG